MDGIVLRLLRLWGPNPLLAKKMHAMGQWIPISRTSVVHAQVGAGHQVLWWYFALLVFIQAESRPKLHVDIAANSGHYDCHWFFIVRFPCERFHGAKRIFMSGVTRRRRTLMEHSVWRGMQLGRSVYATSRMALHLHVIVLPLSRL